MHQPPAPVVALARWRDHPALRNTVRVQDSEVVGLGLGRRLLEIPVYRVSRDQWANERQEELTRWGELTTRVQTLLLDHYGEFAYNQIIGWVQVVRAGSAGHIKAYYFRISNKRIRRRFRQQKFTEQGKVLDCHFDGRNSSTEIMQELRAALMREARKGGRLRGRYLDLEIFDSLVPALNAHKLFGLD